MKKIFKFPSVKNSKNVECLRLYYNRIKIWVRNLKTLGVETNTYGFLLIDLPLLTGKLPDDLRLGIARIFDNDIWELSEILYFVKIELKLKQR